MDKWIDEQLNKGGFWFWIMLLIFSGGLYSLIFFACALG